MSATITLTGTATVARTLPTQGDATTFNSLLTDTTGTTAALTGDMDAAQGVLVDAGDFAELNQIVGIFGKVWGVSGRAAAVRLTMMLNAYLSNPNSVPTGG